MKKAIALMLVLSIGTLGLFTLAACNKKDNNQCEQKYSDTIVAGNYKFNKVTDYLFETTLTDYEQYEKDAKTYMQTHYNCKLGGCSSVQNGKIRGRNYDWTFDEEPEFIIHVPAKEGRHASIGVAATTEITAANVESGNVYPVYNIIPYFTLDGINDAGLTININVVGYEEKGKFELKTKTEEDDVCPIMIPRLILDKCGSIQEAIDLLNSIDIYSLSTAEEAHFMISGPQSKEDSTFNTVVIELIPDENKHYQLNVIDYNKGNFVDNKAIMTNFHLTDFDGTVGSLTAHPMGYERYLILSENYDQGKTVAGMQDLMKKVFYTHCYDFYSDQIWYSEYTAGELTMDAVAGLPKKIDGDTSKAGPFKDALDDAITKYSKLQRDSQTWHTVHTSVYDIEHKALYILPQESGFSYKFTL